MRYFKSTLLCICLVAIFLMHFNVYASDEDKTSAPAIVFENGSSYSINFIDKKRESESIIVYTRNYGEFTEPFSEKTHEYVVVNNIVVDENINGGKGTYIPSNGYVISYTGNDKEFIKNLDTGKSFTLSNIEIPILPEMYFELDGVIVPIDQINSARDANKIALYNPSFGATTKTNAWGMELTVVNNVISKIVDITKEKDMMLDNNSPIPSDGMVISIHSGSPYYKQLHEKAKAADKVFVTTDNTLYNASKVRYTAFNPRTIEDNPAAWDIAEGKPYDGFRGPNQLIVYDSSYGSRTGTNPYGYEVVINSEGRIMSTGGNDSVIPEGGFVLSGHGDKLNWLQKYALLGATVLFNSDKKEVTMIFTPDSYINMALYNLKSAQDSLNLAKQQYLDISYDNVQKFINLAEAKLKKVEFQLDQEQYVGLINAVRDIQNDTNDAYYMTFESAKVENRAVWLRPRDTDIVKIQKRLDMLKDLNINTIYLETYWNGYSIYPTNNAIMQQNPMYNGLDVLGVYLKEAHARGIELHAWVENFLVDQPIASKKPEWMAISKKGDTYYLENGVTKYYFMNPALPEVRDFLSGIYKELVSKYNLDGIQFDYMRYSHSGDYSNDFGYDPYTRQLFANYTGTDPIALKPGDALWQDWCDFRAYIVSSYAYRIFSEVKSIKPNVIISSDVWPDYDKTIVDIYQDPKAWTQKDYINNLVPMSYYLYEAPVVEDINNSWAFAKGHSQLTSGIAAFNKVDIKVFLRQVNAIRASNTNGISIFEYESLFNGGYDKALKLGAFSSPSKVTNRDPEQAIKIVFSELVRKIDDIYIKYDGMNFQTANKYKKIISGINISLIGDADKTKTAYQLKHRIEDLLLVIDSDSTINKEVAKRMILDLNNSLNIIDAYISNIRFMTSHEVREFQVEMPVKVLKTSNLAPLKVKAVFNDNASMYLDKEHYSVTSDNPTSVEIIGDVLKFNDSKEKTKITVDILDSFKFNISKDINKKIELISNQDGKIITNSFYGILKASDAGYTNVRLDWGSTVVDSDIIGYTVYRNNAEIAKTSSDMFYDSDLKPAEHYIYYVYGFDAAGNIIYKSDQVTVDTKTPGLITSH